MANLNPKALKSMASQRLSDTSSNPRMLVLIHIGIIVVLNLLVNGLNLYLSRQIGTTGGLGGMGLRSVLQTAQTILGYISTFFTPFWQAGFLFTMISLSRGENPGSSSLLRGFHRFGRILSYVLWQSVLMTLLATSLMYLCCYVYFLTPFAKDVVAIMESIVSHPELFLADGTMNLEILPMDQLLPAMTPMLILYGIVLILAYCFMSYHFRLGTFLLVEGIERGAFGAFFVSSRLMRGHKWQMLKLDFSFWWFYLLEALLTVVLYLDVLLPLLGIPLPIDSTAAYFITLILYGVLELGLYLWKKADVSVTYALAYDSIYQEALPKEI